MPSGEATLASIGLGHLLRGGTLLPFGVRGVTQTYRGWIEVGPKRIQAYVKLLPPVQVFNEALGSVLCQLAGLPTPPAYLVLVERSDYPDAPIFSQVDASEVLAFGSSAMPMDTLGRRASVSTAAALRELIAKWTLWPDVLVFDQWIANPDRHTGNLLIGRPGSVYLIDHALALLGKKWHPEQFEDAASVVTLRLWKDFLAGLVTIQQRMDGAARARHAEKRFETVALDNAMSLTSIESLVPAAQTLALAAFLHQRRTSAASVVCDAMGVPDLPLWG